LEEGDKADDKMESKIKTLIGSKNEQLFEINEEND